jgi:hypothetical protein
MPDGMHDGRGQPARSGQAIAGTCGGDTDARTHARDVDPLGSVSVTAVSGQLMYVQMISDSGRPIPGVMTPGNTSWRPGVPLGYGRTYTVSVFSRGPGGTPASQVSTFPTLTPRNQRLCLSTPPRARRCKTGVATASER